MWHFHGSPLPPEDEPRPAFDDIAKEGGIGPETVGTAALRRRDLVADLERFELQGPAGTLTGWVTESGDESATPVLFIHPINLQGACWGAVVAFLDPPRRCVLPDLRGHGGSDGFGPYGLEQWGADCLAAMDHFGIKRQHVVGASLGGPLSVYLAAEHPTRIASVTALGSALRIEGEEPEAVLDVLRAKGVREMFREVVPKISVAPEAPEDLIEEIVDLANPNDAETVAEIWGATIASDAGPFAARVRCPVLVATGEHDKTCTPEQGAQMAERLGTSLVLMSGVGHLPMLEDAEATARRSEEFLGSVGGEG